MRVQQLSSDHETSPMVSTRWRIKSEKKCKTDERKLKNQLAKDFAKFMNMSYKEYNKTKSSGNAHDFQKLICSRQYNKLNWNHIPGRALNLLVTSKFLSNHGLKDVYTQWIMSKPVAKYTGYVFELAKKARESGLYRGYSASRLSPEVKHTIDAQFMGLVDKARQNGKITENVWCALDTSGSMSTRVNGLKDITCSDIANSLAIFFSELNTGAFHNKIIMFDDTSYPYDLKGDSFCEKLAALPGVPAGGETLPGRQRAIVTDDVVCGAVALRIRFLPRHFHFLRHRPGKLSVLQKHAGNHPVGEWGRPDLFCGVLPWAAGPGIGLSG